MTGQKTALISFGSLSLALQRKKNKKMSYRILFRCMIVPKLLPLRHCQTSGDKLIQWLIEAMKQTNQIFRPMGRHITIVFSDHKNFPRGPCAHYWFPWCREAFHRGSSDKYVFNFTVISICSSLPLPVCELSVLLTWTRYRTTFLGMFIIAWFHWIYCVDLIMFTVKCNEAVGTLEF